MIRLPKNVNQATNLRNRRCLVGVFLRVLFRISLGHLPEFLNSDRVRVAPVIVIIIRRRSEIVSLDHLQSFEILFFSHRTGELLLFFLHKLSKSFACYLLSPGKVAIFESMCVFCIPIYVFYAIIRFKGIRIFCTIRSKNMYT